MGGVAPRRVLLAEDDTTLAFAVQMLLELDGQWEVDVMGDAERALEYALNERPDVVILDARLHGSDGIEAGERIRRTWAGAAIVVYSGSEEDLERASEAGFRYVLLKGATTDELLDTVERASRTGGEVLTSHEGRGDPVRP